MLLHDFCQCRTASVAITRLTVLFEEPPIRSMWSSRSSAAHVLRVVAPNTLVPHSWMIATTSASRACANSCRVLQILRNASSTGCLALPVVLFLLALMTLGTAAWPPVVSDRVLGLPLPALGGPGSVWPASTTEMNEAMCCNVTSGTSHKRDRDTRSMTV
jgi:hypothetical protein